MTIAAVLAFLSQSWIGQLVTMGLKAWGDYKAKKAAAQADMDADVLSHQNDGVKSVNLRDNIQAQMDQLAREDAALDALANQGAPLDADPKKPSI